MQPGERLFHPISKVIKGVLWQTEGSTLLAATDDILGGKKLAERYLFRTAGGKYFEQYHSTGIGGHLKGDQIKPLDAQEALKRYAAFAVKYLPAHDAFPDRAGA